MQELIDTPVNNTEYICVYLDGGNRAMSDPTFIIIAGEHTINIKYLYDCVHVITQARVLCLICVCIIIMQDVQG